MAGLEGQKAPDFSLEGSDGKKHNLAEYSGKNVVLYFYPKDDTPGVPNRHAASGIRAQSVAVAKRRRLGVSRDGIESHNQFISKF